MCLLFMGCFPRGLGAGLAGNVQVHEHLLSCGSRTKCSPIPTRSRSRSRPGATSVRGKPLRYLQRAGGPSEWQLVPSAIYLRCAVRSSQIGRSFSRAASPHRVSKPKVWQQHAAQVDVSRLRGGSGFTRAKGALPEPRSRVSAGSTKPVAKARPLQLIAAAHRRRRARSSFAIAASSPAMAEITFARPSADGKSGRFIRVVLRWATFLLMSRRPGRDMKDLSWLSSDHPLPAASRDAACGSPVMPRSKVHSTPPGPGA